MLASGTVAVAEVTEVVRTAGREAASRPLLAVLDPVDLAGGGVVPWAGDSLRSASGRAGRFHPLPGPETADRLREFKWNAGRPCHEYQCAVEAGNLLMAEYVMFGTLTPLDGLSAYAIHLLDCRSGKVVESVSGHALRNYRHGTSDGNDSAAVHLAALAAALDPAGFDRAPRGGRGLIAVLDRSPGSAESRVLVERIGSRVHSRRTHDLMGQTELQELADGMGIPLALHAATDTGLLALGALLNVAYLVQPVLEQDSLGLRLEIAVFDVAGQRRVRRWKSDPARDFAGILQLESRYFRTLRDWPAEAGNGTGGGGVEAAGRGLRKGRLLGLAGLSAAGGLGAWAYVRHRKAEAAFRRAESSRIRDEADHWRERTETEDRRTVLLGSLAALTLGASVTVLTF